MTLTIQDLGALGELLGSVAVLATLVYLALQTRQNTMAISAQLDAARIGAQIDVGLAAVTSTELQEALLEDRIDPRPINAERRGRFWAQLFLVWQWQFAHAQRGLLPTFNEAGMARSVRSTFNRYRSFDEWWETSRGIYIPEFVEWVEEQRSKAA